MFGTSCILGCFGEGPYDNAKGESIWSGATMPTFKQCWEKTWARDSSQNYSFRQFKKTSQNIVLQTKEDPRTQCYKATQLYVESKKPDVVLLEMVKGVLGKKFRKTVFRKWMNMLLGWCFVFYNSKIKNKRPNAILLRLNGVMDGHGRKYYNVHAAVLNASYFGLPQARQRLFIIALRRGKQVAPFKFPSPWKKAVNLSMVVNKKFCGGRKRRRILVLKEIQQIEFWRLWVQQSYPPLFESFS